MNYIPNNQNALIINQKLKKFLSKLNGKLEFVSLGQNCSTAWYLKAAGLKKSSYPFDWIFSSTAITIDCIKDEFRTFMDRKSMIDNGKYAGHDNYHKHFFYHRNPLASETEFTYYQRCCERFNNLARVEHQPVFVLTLLPEVEKRKAWREGFTQNFPLPSLDSECHILTLSKFLEKHFQKHKLIVFEQWTETQPRINFELKSPNIAYIKFYAVGKNGGMRYHDAIDENSMITLLKGLDEV